MKRFLFSLFLGLVSGGILLYSQLYPGSLPASLEEYIQLCIQKIEHILAFPVVIDTAHNMGIQEFLKTPKGMGSFQGVGIFVISFIALYILNNIVSFFRDFFAFFPITK